jgi:hypothetical protein
MTKAERLEAKAAKLREAELARANAAANAPESAPANWRTLALSLAAATVVLLIAFVLTLGYATHERSRADKAALAAQLQSLRASALKTAVTVATSFGTYDYKTLPADFARTKAYLTPSFAANYAKLTASLATVITQDKGQEVGTVQGAGISSITTSTAVVVVLLDQKVTTIQSSTPRLDHNRLILTLARQKDGSWLASKLKLV